MRTFVQFVVGSLLAGAALAQQAAAPAPLPSATAPVPSLSQPASLPKGAIAANALLPGALAPLMASGQCEQIVTAGQVSWCLAQCGTNVITYFGGDGVTTTPPPPPVACFPVCYVLGASSQCIAWGTP